MNQDVVAQISRCSLRAPKALLATLRNGGLLVPLLLLLYVAVLVQARQERTKRLIA